MPSARSIPSEVPMEKHNPATRNAAPARGSLRATWSKQLDRASSRNTTIKRMVRASSHTCPKRTIAQPVKAINSV